MGDPHEGKKLIVLGLPWASDEKVVWSHFGGFGALSDVEIIRDKTTGKSRGFGFVHFCNAEDAQRAVDSEHTIDGRRCDVKQALPKGQAPSLVPQRLFVGRIPPHVTEKEFEEYFAAFGDIEDAYMPKDHKSQTHRRIGFVSYEDSSSIDKVMSVSHKLDGFDIVVDRATPKESHLDNPAVHDKPVATTQDIQQATTKQVDAPVPEGCSSKGLEESNKETSIAQSSHGSQFDDQIRLFMFLQQQQEYMEQNQISANTLTLEDAHGPFCAFKSMVHELQTTPRDHRSFSREDPASKIGEMSPAGNTFWTSSTPRDDGQHDLRRSMSVPSIGSSQGGSASSRLVQARNGPRLFVGKLTKDIGEKDLRDYFIKFGYVLDVYMPRAKDKREHRGFGFVTFETNAAIERVAAHGTHEIKNVAIAVDEAVPEGPLHPSQNNPQDSMSNPNE